MPDPTLEFVEDSPVGAPDTTQLFGVVGFCSAPPGMKLPAVLAIDDASTIRPLAGYGPGAELTAAIRTRADERVILSIPSCSIPGSLSAVTQTGKGPLVTCVVDAATPTTLEGPFDNGFCALRVATEASATAPATYQLAYTWVMVQGKAEPFYQPAQIVPPRVPATVIGKAPLKAITYAKPATVTGGEDLTALTWGPGGDLDGLDFKGTLDGGAAVSFLFAAPASPQQALDQIDAAFGAKLASLTLQDTLNLTSPTLGKLSSISLTGGSALPVLGLVAGLAKGDAGDLDGKDLLIVTDQGPATVTFGTPPDAEAVAKEADAAPGVASDLYTTAPYLRLSSATLGDVSSFMLTGGTALAALGLEAMASAVKGAESSVRVPHLGITWKIQPGNLRAGTTYGVTTRAPSPTTDERKAAVEAVYGSQYAPFAFVWADAAPDVMTSFGVATSAAQLIGEQQTKRRYPHVIIGLSPEDDDNDIKGIFAQFNSAWVDMCARGAYCVGTEPGGGGVLRPASWPCAVAGAAIPYDQDRGDGSVLPNPLASYVIGVTAIESGAPVKLVQAVGSPGMSFNVLTGAPGNYRFEGGYTSADGLSRYADQSTRNAVQRAAAIAILRLLLLKNATRGIYTTSKGTLRDDSASAISTDIETAVKGQMGVAIQDFAASVLTTNNYSQDKTINIKMQVVKPPPARVVRGVIGPVGAALSTTGALALEG